MLLVRPDQPDPCYAAGALNLRGAGRTSAPRFPQHLRGGGVSAVLDPTGRIDTLNAWSGYAAYNHYWTDALNSSFVLAHAETDSPAYQLDSSIESVTSAHVNLIWFPYKSVSTGVEVMWGERQNKDGAKGDAVRLQAMLKYKFN